MKADKYLQELASRLELAVVPGLNPYMSNKESTCAGTAAGKRSGYIVSVSRMQSGNNRYIGIMIRWPALADKVIVQSALEAMPEFKGFAKSRRVALANDGACITWTYSLKAPKPEEIAHFIDAVIAVACSYAPGFSGKCEDCNSSGQTQITAMNGVPGYHCSSCQSRIAGQQEELARQYEQRTPNISKALLYSTVVAALYAILQAGFLFLFSDEKGTPIKAWVVFALCTGVIVPKVFAKFVEKIEVWPQGIYVAVITIAANIAADILFLTFYIPKYDPQFIGVLQPSARLAMELLREWPRYRFAWGIELFITGAELLAGPMAFQILRKDRPDFTPVFQEVAPPQMVQSAARF